MRVLVTAAAAAVLLCSSPALAQQVDPSGGGGIPPEVVAEEPAAPAALLTITGSAGIVSQYRFRGISLSGESPAVQGTINLNHASGPYAGFSASSTDSFGELGGSNVELDLYAGYKKEVSPGITLDAGLLYYAYPGSEGGDFEFFEPYANISGAIGPITAKAGVAYAWDQHALTGNSNVYAFADFSSAIPDMPVTLKGHVGYSKGDTPLTPGGDYVDWLLGADFTLRELTLGVAYVDTNLSGAEAALGGATRDIVDSALVFSLGAAF